MSKSKLRPPPGVGAGLMEKIAQMRQEMMHAQDELAEQRLTITVGGEAVTVVVDGRQHFHHLLISPEALAAAQNDKEMLQELLVVAVNQAIEQSQTLAAERLQGLTGGLGLPDV
jgi:DNA-binding YbaB/EbfC family protein